MIRDYSAARDQPGEDLEKRIIGKCKGSEEGKNLAFLRDRKEVEEAERRGHRDELRSRRSTGLRTRRLFQTTVRTFGSYTNCSGK